VKKIYDSTKSLPDSEKFGLKSQMQRAAVSIPSNIAEGCGRNSEIEFKRFLEIAIGSAFELETQLIICFELEYIDQNQLDKILEELNRLQKQINSLISKIKKASS
jgi:four helix bundle protein